MIVRRTVLRLTLTYTAIQLSLYALVAIGVYAFVTGTFDYDSVRGDGTAAVTGVDAGFAHLRTGLVLCFAVLAVVVPFLSYAMARRALRPLQASYTAQQRFVDDASHEFRTPLSILQAEIELALSRPRTPAEYVRVLDDALDEVAGLTTLTGDLLLLARGSSAELSEAFEVLSLASVARAALARAGQSGPDRPTATIEDTDDVLVTGSHELLTRAVGNLIDNAIRHTPTTGTITITLTHGPETATIRVADTGTGMSPDEQRRAFDRFWRADEARSQPGHGLGLPLVQQIATAHRGHATLTDTPGGGTTASLVLPRHTRPNEL
jgi:signal transduction histidine kinase